MKVKDLQVLLAKTDPESDVFIASGYDGHIEVSDFVFEPRCHKISIHVARTAFRGPYKDDTLSRVETPLKDGWKIDSGSFVALVETCVTLDEDEV